MHRGSVRAAESQDEDQPHEGFSTSLSAVWGLHVLPLHARYHLCPQREKETREWDVNEF